MSTTIRGEISDLVNDLNKLRNNIDDLDQRENIQKVLRVLFMLWEEVIRQQLDPNTSAYKFALKSLGEAEKAAKDAIGDINKVAEAIKSAAKAAKAIDEVVKVLVTVSAL